MKPDKILYTAHAAATGGRDGRAVSGGEAGRSRTSSVPVLERDKRECRCEVGGGLRPKKSLAFHKSARRAWWRSQSSARLRLAN